MGNATLISSLIVSVPPATLTGAILKIDRNEHALSVRGCERPRQQFLQPLTGFVQLRFGVANGAT
jgi:hypothetical protein